MSRAALKIDVRLDDRAWAELLPGLAGFCRRVVRQALTGRLSGATEIAVILSDDTRVHALNRRWRGKDKPTNVLSFPGDSGDVPSGATRLLGDVVLARQTVAREAAAQGKTVADHMAHLLVHGALHLLGFDHQAEAEAATMEALEVSILARLEVDDPYRDRSWAQAS